MSDPRIGRYISAIDDMGRGNFRVAPQPHGADDIAELGRRLAALASTLERRFAQINSLIKATEKINAALLVDDVLDEMFVAFQPIVPYQRMGCSLIEEEGAIARAIWVRSMHAEPQLPVGYVARLEGSSLSRILETGEPRIINDLESYLEQNPGSESTRRIVEEGIRSSLTVPLLALGKRVGFLFFSSVDKHAYQQTHVELIVQIAAQASHIIEKSRLYMELAQTKSRLEAANAELLRETHVDQLTTIANRRALDARLDLGVRRATRKGTSLTLAMIDIDQFKRYNDHYGHIRGDECLRRVALALRSALRRPDDFVGRYGGEEFLAIVDAERAREAGEMLRAVVTALKIPHAPGASRAHLTVSVGVMTTRGESPIAAVGKADQALYKAKAAGGDCVEVAAVVESLAAG